MPSSTTNFCNVNNNGNANSNNATNANGVAFGSSPHFGSSLADKVAQAKSDPRWREGGRDLPMKGKYVLRRVRADAACMAALGDDALFHAR